MAIPLRAKLVFAVSIFLAGCSFESPSQLVSDKILDYKNETTRYMVRLSDDLSVDDRQKLIDQELPFGARLSLALKDTAYLDLTKVEAGQRLRVLEELIVKQADIKYIESDELMQANAFVIDDPHFRKQWSHRVVRSAMAWKSTEEPEEIVVAVIDGGVDINHPDLKDNIWVNPREKKNNKNDDTKKNDFVDDIHGWDFAKEDNDPSSDDTKDSHGTHVAGIIGAVIGNGLGVAGHGSNVKIMPLRYLVNGDGYTKDSIRAIRYAIDNGARIINLSSGSFKAKERTREILREAEKAGVLVVAAAGNYKSDIDDKPYYPASYGFSNLISVAATDAKDKLWVDSNYGVQNAHIAAPGVSIYSTVNRGYPVKTRSGKKARVDYVAKWGTSMAAPVVSAVAAMVLGVRPDLKPHQVKEILFQAADQVDQLQGKVAGQRRLNAEKAVALAQRYGR